MNLHEVYTFSKALHPLSHLKDDLTIKANIFVLWGAREELEAMVKAGSPLLGTARRAAMKLIETIDQVIPKNIIDAFDISDQETFGYRASLITESLKELESVLRNDMPGIAAYLVSQKGIFNTDDLISNAERYFPDDIQVVLPAQACNDLREAGRCLAYELATACVFHLWRAVETVMLAYCHRLTGQEWKGKNKNWAAYIAALKEAKADERITVFLEHIRTQYRNPQTHPDEAIGLMEALQLFGTAMSSINQMLVAIQKLQIKSPRVAPTGILPPAVTMLTAPLK